MMYSLFVVALFFSNLGACVGDNDKSGPKETLNACDRLKKGYDKRGFIPPSERETYCFSGCTFLNVDCGSFDLPQFEFDISEFREFIEGFMDGAIDVNDAEHSIDEATLGAWFIMMKRVWPLLMSVLPIVLNQWKYYNFWWAVFILMLNGVIAISGGLPPAIGFHNLVITGLALIHSSNSTYLVESVWTILMMIAAVGSVFIVEPVWQVTILILSVIGFFLYIHNNFFLKRGGLNAGVVVVVCQVAVMFEQLYFTRTHMADKSLGGAALEMCLNSIIPTGRSRFWIKNVVHLADTIAYRLPWSPGNPWVFVCLVLFQVIAYMLFRAAIGAFYLHVLRYRTDPEALLHGMYIYLVDAFGPVRCIWRLVFRIENYQNRRMMYAVIGMLLSYFEWNWSVGWFRIRIVMSLIEVVLVRSSYGRMTHYLEFDIDMRQVAFPQYEAFPWVSLKQLSDVAKYTDALIAMRGDNCFKGMSVVLNSGGRAMLYTVEHVIKGATMVQFLNQTVSSPDFRSVNTLDDDDPMVGMKVEVEGAPDIEILTKSEAFNVQLLTFINSDKDGDKFICPVSKYKLERGKLYASVHLRKGDSGGPVFAILTTGEMRFCGVVSKGNPRRGGGNIISFCYSEESADCDSSVGSTHLNDVNQFNKIRRVRFASDDPKQTQYEASRTAMQMISTNAALLRIMKDWKAHVKFSERHLDTDAVYMRLAEDGAFMRNNRDGDNDDEYDDGSAGNAGPGDKKTKRHDAKRRNKDKAARKRAVGTLQKIGIALQLAYSLQDCESIFTALASGDVPDLDDRTIISGYGGGQWVFSDEPNDPAWH